MWQVNPRLFKEGVLISDENILIQLFNKNYFEIVEQICGTGPIQIRNPSHSSRWSFDKSN